MAQEDNYWEILTPINLQNFKSSLRQSGYDATKSVGLIQGFSRGFDIGYRGPEDRIDESRNLPLNIGLTTDLWNKIIKEVEQHRYAGPFFKPPYSYYVQSPIGLVPKANNKMRLIFHLSYDFGK